LQRANACIVPLEAFENPKERTMKNLVILGGIVLCLISLQLSAQVKAPLNELPAEKPLLFTDLPEKFSISLPAIEKIFAGSSTGNVKIAIDNNRSIEGIIVEKLARNPNLITMNIRLPQYRQALFTISRLTGINQPAAYSGRIIHLAYGDVLKLTQENDRLYLLKEKQSALLAE
jgi:hypothetical protein